MIFVRKTDGGLVNRTVTKVRTHFESVKHRYVDEWLYEDIKSKSKTMASVKKLSMQGAALFMFGVIFGWILFPMILQYSVHKQVNLKEGSQARKIWAKFPFYLEFRVWLFNITNPEAIDKGAKPIVQEVGPYFFEEWQEKAGIVDYKENDTVEFSIKNKWIFRPDLSNGLSGNEVLTLPHLLILSMVMTSVRNTPIGIVMLNKLVDDIFHSPKSIFWKVRAMDYMFDGMPIDCSSEETVISTVCSYLRIQESIQQNGPNDMKFSLLGTKNNTAPRRKLTVLRGVKKQNDIGVVVEYDGKPNASTWGDPYCDTFNGTDGTIFHPFLYEDEDLVSFSPDICRSLSLSFQKKTKFAGLKTNRYTAFLGDPKADPKLKCFCPSTDHCLKKGVMDLHKCVGVPLVLSHPHFYLADEEYSKMVHGLSPSQEKHELYVDFEPFTGSPVSARKRIQLNMMIHAVDKFKLMRNFPNALLPLFWIEESVDIPKFLIRQIKMGHISVKFVGILKWLMVFSGLGLSGLATFKYYQMILYQKSIKSDKTLNNIRNAVKNNSKILPLNIRNLEPVSVPPTLNQN